MTSYLATIRFEASGDGEANLIASQWAEGRPVTLCTPGEVVEFLRRDGVAWRTVATGDRVTAWVGGPSEPLFPSEPPRYVTEAIEVAKRELYDDIGHLRAEVREALDIPSDVLVERVAKRLAERRLLEPLLKVRLPRCTGHVGGRWCGLPSGHAGYCQCSEPA